MGIRYQVRQCRLLLLDRRNLFGDNPCLRLHSGEISCRNELLQSGVINLTITESHFEDIISRFLDKPVPVLAFRPAALDVLNLLLRA